MYLVIKQNGIVEFSSGLIGKRNGLVGKAKGLVGERNGLVMFLGDLGLHIRVLALLISGVGFAY